MPAFIRMRRASITAREHSIRGHAGPARGSMVSVGVGRSIGNGRSIPSRPATLEHMVPAAAPTNGTYPSIRPIPLSPFQIEQQAPAPSKLSEVRGKLARLELDRERIMFAIAQASRCLDNGDTEGAKIALRSAKDP